MTDNPTTLEDLSPSQGRIATCSTAFGMRLLSFLLVASLQLACSDMGAVLDDAYPKPDSMWPDVPVSDAVISDAPVVVDAWPSAASCTAGTFVLPHRFLAREDWGWVQGMTFDVDYAYAATESPPAVVRVPLSGGVPEIVAEGIPDYMAVDDTDMYMVSSDTLWRMPKTGGDLQRLTTSERRPLGLVVDDQDVYIGAMPGIRLWRFSKTDWSETILAQTAPFIYSMVGTETDIYWSTITGLIEKVPKDGSPALILARHQDMTRRLAVGAEGVYYTNFSHSADPDFGAVRFVPTEGAAPDLVIPAEAIFSTNNPLVMHTGNLVLEIDPITNSHVVAYNPGTYISSLVDEPDDAFITYGGIRDWFVPGQVYHYRKSTDELTVLADDQYYPYDIHTDDTHVYFVNIGDNGVANGTVSRVPRGGGPVEDLVVGLRYPSTMVLDGDRVYWINSEGGTIGSVAKTGGVPSLVTSGHSWPHKLSLYGGALFWANYTDGRIMKYTLPAGPEEVLAVDQSRPNHLYVENGRVYWSNQGGAAEHPYSLLSMPVDGGEIQALIESGVDWWIAGVAVVAGYVYYSLWGYAYAVYRVPVEGRGPETIEVGVTKPYGIGLSEQYVYWTNDRTLRRRSRAGGAVEILTTPGPVTGLWSEGTILYWRTPGGLFCASVD